MNFYKVIYSNGDHEIVSINLSYEDAKRYYLGHVFNIGTVDDHLVKCVKIEPIEAQTKN